MIPHAQDAFGVVNPSDPFYNKAMEYRKSCDEELDAIDDARARTGFEETRMFAREMSAHMRGGESIASPSYRIISQHSDQWVAITASSFKHSDQSSDGLEVKPAVFACSLEKSVITPHRETWQCLNFGVTDLVSYTHANVLEASAEFLPNK